MEVVPATVVTRRTHSLPLPEAFHRALQYDQVRIGVGTERDHLLLQLRLLRMRFRQVINSGVSAPTHSVPR